MQTKKYKIVFNECFLIAVWSIKNLRKIYEAVHLTIINGFMTMIY